MPQYAIFCAGLRSRIELTRIRIRPSRRNRIILKCSSLRVITRVADPDGFYRMDSTRIRLDSTWIRMDSTRIRMDSTRIRMDSIRIGYGYDLKKDQDKDPTILKTRCGSDYNI